ncbi:sigma-70 family RNA polymerase sigma factor [Streptacidiphilus sp. 4-A2]|nr:sigma-70 family RNA polymerase sigma factor [Streptacidiphilus sp. 4-A2]
MSSGNAVPASTAGSVDPMGRAGPERAAVPESFAEFWTRTSTGMVAKAVMLCGHVQDAEDAVQDSYIEAAKVWDRIGGYQSAEGWVYKVMRQRLWKTARARSRHRKALLQLPVPPGATQLENDTASEVLAALALLPHQQRMVLLLCCVDRLTQEEVATMLGIRRGTVANHLFKARRTLAAALGMTPPKGRADRDSLLADRTWAGPVTDPLDEALLGAGTWLRAAFETDPGSLDRIRDHLAQHGAGQDAGQDAGEGAGTRGEGA